MDPEALSAALLSVVVPLAQERQGGDVEGLDLADFPLERPRNRDHGDWASNAALKLAKRFGMPPSDLAAAIAERLREVDGIASVDVAGMLVDGDVVLGAVGGWCGASWSRCPSATC